MVQTSQPYPTTILIIDDDTVVLQLLENWLSRQGYLVRCAGSSQEALQLAVQYHPDLLLLDMQFTEMHGLDWLTRLRADEGFGDVPVIVITTTSNAVTQATALEYGAQDYITKPVAPDELLARVQVQLRARRTQTALLVEQRRKALLYDIARDLATSLDLGEILQRIVASTVTAVRATHGTLILLDEQQGPRITTASQQGISPANPTTLRVLEYGLAGWVLRHGTSVLIEDTMQDSRWLHIAGSPYQATSVLAVPLYSRGDGQTIDGVLTLSHEAYATFSHEDLSLLETVADHAGLAIKQARLHQRERRRATQLSMLIEITARINRMQDLDETLQHVCEATTRLLDTDYALIEIFDPASNTFIVRAAYGVNAVTRGQDTPVVLGIAERTVVYGKLFAHHDILLLDEMRAQLHATEIRSLVSAPIHDCNEQMIGAISTGYYRAQHHGVDDGQILALLAQQIAVVFQNYQLYNTVVAERQTLHAVLTSAREGILVTDGQGRGRLINPAASLALGISPERFVGAALDELALPAALCAQLNQVQESGDLVLELHGHTYHVLVAPVSRAEDGAVAVLTNVTHFKALDLLKSQFLSTASHDLKSPLSIIAGYNQAIQLAGPLNERQQHYVGRIAQNIRRLVALISDLLDLSSMDMRLSMKREPCVLNELLRSDMEDYHDTASQKQLTLHIHITRRSLVVNGDAMRLRQVLDNLINNAVKYTPSGGKIELSLRRLENYALVQVADTGIGLTEADCSRVFERFYRVESSETSAIEGTGLGLAIVKMIVEAHEGRVWVESTLGEGSTFNVLLPLYAKPYT